MESSKIINRKRKLVQDSSYEGDWNLPPAKISTYFNKVQISSVQNEDSFYTIDWRNLIGEASIWPFLTIQGPYQYIFSHLGNSVAQNKSFRKLIRFIALKIHTNAVRFRKEDIPMLIRNINDIEIDDVIDIADRMCQKVFRFKIENGSSFVFYEKGQVKRLGSLFAKKKLKIEFDASQEIVERMKFLCSYRNFYVTSEQLSRARNAFVRYIFDLSLDLILYITKREAKNDRILIGKIIKKPFICDNREAHVGFKWLRVSARLDEVSTSLMERNEHKSSIWIPSVCEEQESVLESVFGYGLIQILPQKAREFVNVWVPTVKTRIVRLPGEPLRQTIKKFMCRCHNQRMTLGDARVKRLLVKIGDRILNYSEDFVIFNEEWQNYTLDLIGKMRGEAFEEGLDCEKLVRQIREMTTPSVIEMITSFFPNITAGHKMVSHVLVHLLRFVLCFLLNTIRHVFHFDPNTFKVYYDGQFEGDEEKAMSKNHGNAQKRNEGLPIEKPAEVKNKRKRFDSEESLEDKEKSAGIHQEHKQETHVSGREDHRNAEKTANKQRHAASDEPISGKTQQNFEVRSNKQPKKELQPEMIVKAEPPDDNHVSMIPVPSRSNELHYQNPPQDPVQVRHQAPGPSRNVFLNPCSSTQKVPVVQGKDSIDIDEDVPLKWQKGYKLLVEWNQELETEFRRIQETLSQFK